MRLPAEQGLGTGAGEQIHYGENAKFGSPFATLDAGGHWYFMEPLGMHRTLDLSTPPS